MEQFRDNDQAYLGWVAAHADGYVINIQRSMDPADALPAPCRLLHDQR